MVMLLLVPIPAILLLAPAHPVPRTVLAMKLHQNQSVAMVPVNLLKIVVLALKTVCQHPAWYLVLLIQKQHALMALLLPVPTPLTLAHAYATTANQTVQAMEQQNVLEKEKVICLEKTSNAVLA